MELATYPLQQTGISLQATQKETPEAWGSVTENTDGNFPMPFNGICKKIMEMHMWYLG